MQIIFDRDSIFVSQERYIDSLLIKFNMLECKSAKIPIETKLNYLYNEDGKEIDVPYQSLIGSLMYLAVLTRPDIAYSVSFFKSI